MCTNFKLKSEDQAIIVGRTMEFGVDLKSRIVTFPRDYSFTANAPDGMTPLSWKGQYGLIGPDSFGLDVLSDGMNEKGLYVGCLYLPGYAKYMEPSSNQNGNLISQNDVSLWMLSQFETVDEIKEKIANITVWGMTYPGLGIVPIHYAVHDAQGNSIVIEYTEGKLHVYDNPVGTLTNSPEFPWHVINLSNFVNLSANNVPELKLTGNTLKPSGEGSGMLGLPGDFTPPSRFIRATALTQSAIPGKTAEEEVKIAFHILGSFDIPTGLTREKKGDHTYYEYTQWMTVADLTNKIYYFRTYENPGTLKIDLTKLNFTGSTKQYIDMSASWFVDAKVTASS